MQPIDEYVEMHGIASAWRDFKPCCNKDENYLTDLLRLFVEDIADHPRLVIERDFYYNRIYNSIDFYFTIPNDDGIYVVQTNIRMCKYFSGKWHWRNEAYAVRMYRIPKAHVNQICDLFIKTYAVDETEALYEKYNDELDDWDRYDHSVEPVYMWNEYITGSPPYTNLKFFDELPEFAVGIDIGDCDTINVAHTTRIFCIYYTLIKEILGDSARVICRVFLDLVSPITKVGSIQQAIALILTRKPCKNFGNGR